MLHIKKSNTKNIQIREGYSNHHTTAFCCAEIPCKNW